MTWPGIQDINFNKFITKKLPIAKGHLDQERANLQSTKVSNHEDTDFNLINGAATKTRENITKFNQLTWIKQGAFCTGHPEATMYNHNVNAILAKVIPNRQAKIIAAAWEDIHKRLTQHGHETKNYKITNAVEN